MPLLPLTPHGRGPSAVLALACAAVLAGCETTVLESSTSSPLEPPGLEFDWLGTYDGIISGTDHGMTFSREPARLVIFFSDSTGCDDGVAIRLDTIFDRCNLMFTSAVTATFDYRLGSKRHMLQMDRFTGNSDGDVLRGTAMIEEEDSSGAVSVAYVGIFEVSRR